MDEKILTLPEKLNLLRKRLKLTQKDVEEKTGINQVTLSKYETGQDIPQNKNLILLARLYYVTSDYLLGIDKDPDAPEPQERPVNTIMKAVLDDEAGWRSRGYLPPSKTESEYILKNIHFRLPSFNPDKVTTFYWEALPFVLNNLRKQDFLKEK